MVDICSAPVRVIATSRGSAANVAPASPLLRWAGSKRQVVPLLLGKAPCAYKRYVEPFAGSASLFFALKPASALLSDSNEELIGFMQQVRSNADTVYSLAASVPRDLAAYTRMRALRPRELSDVERAARFFFLNRHCFNGVYRVNRRGDFNVPMGKKLPPFPTIDAVRAASALLANAELRASDFEPVLSDCGEGDFLYVDPPYSTSDRHRGEYGARMFDESDLSRLCTSLKSAVRRGAQIALSFPSSPRLKRELATWKHCKVQVRRTVAAATSARGQGGEGLFLSYE
jgi:DNA adenine methylase